MIHLHTRTAPADGRGRGPSGRAARLRGAARTILAVGAAAALAACSSSEFGGGNPNKTASMRLDGEVPGAGGAASARAGLSVSPSVTISDADVTFTVDSVDLVLRETQVGQEGAECIFTADDSGGGDGGDGTACEEYNGAPVIQTLPVDAGTAQFTSDAVVPGTWAQLAFQLHPLDQQDVSLVNDRPDMQGFSVFVEVSVEGVAEPVELRFAPTEEHVLMAPEPVALSGQEAGVVTLVVDVGSWFDDPDGGVIDPRNVEGDQALTDQIEANIDASLGIRMEQQG